MARKDTSTEVNEKPQNAAETEHPVQDKTGPETPIAPVESALQAIVEEAAPLVDGAASDGGLDPEDQEAKPPATAPIPLAIRVIGPARGRWRIGRRFGPEPVDIPVDELSEEEADALAADPLLIIHASPFSR